MRAASSFAGNVVRFAVTLYGQQGVLEVREEIGEVCVAFAEQLGIALAPCDIEYAAQLGAVLPVRFQQQDHVGPFDKDEVVQVLLEGSVV